MEASAPLEVLLGNPNPQMQVRDAEGSVSSVPAEHLNQSVTSVEFADSSLDPEHVALALSTDNDRFLTAIARSLPEGTARDRYALAIYELEQIVAVHMGGASPTWISCEGDPELQAVAAEHFGAAQGEPRNVFTNAGRDALHEQHLKSTQPAAFKYGALSPSTGTPEATDTTLAEEITTASGGLIRKEMTFAHTAGTSTSTLTLTWTVNASDTGLPVTIRRWANFNKAESGGTIGMSDKLATTAVLSAVGDSITVTFTFTAA